MSFTGKDFTSCRDRVGGDFTGVSFDSCRDRTPPSTTTYAIEPLTISINTPTPALNGWAKRAMESCRDV